jgi:hypothetical protein
MKKPEIPWVLSIKDILLDEDGKMTTVVLSNGAHLGGIVDAQMRIAPDMQTVVVSMAIEAKCTLNGAAPVDAFKAELERRKSIVSIPKSSLVGPDGRVLS